MRAAVPAIASLRAAWSVTSATRPVPCCPACASSATALVQRLAVGIEERDVGTVGGHHLGIGETDAGRAAGDDRGEAFHIEKRLGLQLVVRLHRRLP